MPVNNDDIQQAMLSASGRGISPVPASGGGLWDSIKGFTKKAFHFASPHVQKAAGNLARDLVGGLNQRLSQDNRTIEI